MGARRRARTARQPAGPELPRPRGRRPATACRRRGEDHEPRVHRGGTRRAGRRAARIAAAWPATPRRDDDRDADGAPRSVDRRHERGRRSASGSSSTSAAARSRATPTSHPRSSRAWASSPRARASPSRASTHPGLDRVLQWDPRSPIASSSCWRRITPTRRDGSGSTDAAASAWAQLGALAADLPATGRAPRSHRRQRRVHVRARHPAARRAHRLRRRHRSWAVAELAITISSVLHHAGAEPVSVLPGDPGVPRPATAVGGGGRGDLAARRAARRRARRERRAPGAARRRRRTPMPPTGIEREWRIFEQAISVPSAGDDGRHRRRRSALSPSRCRAARPSARPRALAPGFAPDRAVRIDISITADAVDAGAWLDPDLEERLALAALDAGHPPRGSHARRRASPPRRTRRRRSLRHGAGRHRHLVLGGPGRSSAPDRPATRRRRGDRWHAHRPALGSDCGSSDPRCRIRRSAPRAARSTRRAGSR